MDKLLSVAEVADYLDCSESWLNKARYIGGGPDYVKMGTKVRYRRKDIDDWINHRIYQNTSEYNEN